MYLFTFHNWIILGPTCRLIWKKPRLQRRGSGLELRRIKCNVQQLKTNVTWEGQNTTEAQSNLSLALSLMYTLLGGTTLERLYFDPESFILQGLLVTSVFVLCLSVISRRPSDAANFHRWGSSVEIRQTHFVIAARYKSNGMRAD